MNQTTKTNHFDPDRIPEIQEMRRTFEREAKAEAEAERKREDFRRRASDAREEAQARETEADELEDEIRAAFINGQDDKATKLRSKQEGERRRAEAARHKAETLEDEADQVEPEELDPPPKVDWGPYWRTVCNAIEEEVRRRVGDLACVGAMAYRRGGPGALSVTPDEFVKKAFEGRRDPQTRAVLRYGINSHHIPSLDAEDHPIPREGVLAALINPEKAEKDKKDKAA